MIIGVPIAPYPGGSEPTRQVPPLLVLWLTIREYANPASGRESSAPASTDA